jgi:hypothetical protein
VIFPIFNPFVLRASELGILYVGGVTGGLSNSTANFDVSLAGTLTGGLASSPATGDQVLVVIGSVCGSTGVNMACSADGTTAYTEVRAPAYVNSNPDTRFGVYRREQTATPDSFVRVNGGTNISTGGAAVLVMVFRAVDAATPLDVAVVTAQLIASNDINPPAITPVTDRALIIACGASAHLAANTTEPTRNGWTPTLYRNQVGSVNGVKAAAECLVWRTGDNEINPATWTDPDTGETSPTWAAATLALRPAA